MHLHNVIELIPVGEVAIARRKAWKPMQLVELSKSNSGMLEVRDVMTGEKDVVSPISTLADDWEIAY